MNRTKLNIVANFAGRAWIAIISILFVPVYLQYLSVEVYGIIGFFSGLQSILTLLDGGISPTLSREIARLSAFSEKAQEMRDLSRTLEILCWIIALLISGIAILISSPLSKHWLRAEQISTETIFQALVLMSISFIFQWTTNFYTGGLIGLQRQTAYNLVNSIGVTFRSVGAFLILAFVSPTIQAFLMWQALASLLTVILMRSVFWRCLPLTARRAKFQFDLLNGVWRYTAGMAGLNVVNLILSQSDKIILSRLLSLEYFGYYALASTLSTAALGTVIGSIGSVFFSQYSQFVAAKDFDGLRKLYHRSCQIMSVFLLPVMIMFAVFPFEILHLWTRNEQIAANSYILLSLLAIGTGFNGLMTLPYFMQLAFGTTKIAFYLNLAAVILLIPFMIFTASRYGAIGGALTWVILNFLYIVVGLQIMNRLLLQGELKRWYIEDVGIALAAALAVAFVARIIISEPASPVYAFITLAFVSSLLFLVCILVLPEIRQVLFRQFNWLPKT